MCLFQRLYPFVLCLCLGLTLVGAGSVSGQTKYLGDGEPTAREEEIRWLVNRARFSRSKENARRGSNYLDITSTCGPLAPNAKLTLAARHHSEDLARKNRFQHTTVPGSFYYNPSTHPNLWDRISAEGYAWNTVGENIAAGYPSAASVYLGWWHSAGHRVNMFNRNFREIGNGHFYWASSTNLNNYGLSLGRAGSHRFFTGTLFQDVNGNRGYTQGEGRGGVKVELVTGGVAHTNYDVSTSVGSFAIPTGEIYEGAMVRVVLTNTTASPVTVSVPRNYDTLETIVMGPNESRPWGQFVLGDPDLNYGFSDAELPTEFITLTPANREHSASAGSGFSFAVDGNVNWTAASNQGWLRVAAGQSGTGAGTITYEMDAQTFGDPRVGLITLTGEANVVRTFEVRQLGVPTALGVGVADVNVGEAGASGLGVNVTANVTWNATKAVHWIQFSGASGAVGDGALSWNVMPNTGSVAREAVISVTGGGETRLVTVRQAAGAVRRVGETFALSAAEGVGTVQKVTGLPNGMIFDRLTGQVSGRPTQSGTFLVKVDVMVGSVVEKRVMTLVVSALPGSAVGTFEMRVGRDAGLGGGLGGNLTFVTTASGSVSGTLSLVGKSYAWRGVIGHATGMEPEVVATVVRSGDVPVLLKVTLKGEHLAVGTATPGVGGVAVGVEGWRRVWALKTAEVQAARVGRMHVVMDLKAGWVGDVTVPQGSGYAVMTVGRDGRVAWSGKMPQGSSVVRSGWMGPNGESGFWLALHGVQGSVMGNGISALTGTYLGDLDWVKKGPSSATDRTYAAGFGVDMRGPVGLGMKGEMWQVPGKGQALLDVLALAEVVENMQVGFVGGVQADTAAPVADLKPTLTRQNRMVLPASGAEGNPNRVMVQVSATTGRVTGEFTLTDPPLSGVGAAVKRRVLFNGLMLSKSVEVGGFFTAPKRVTAPQPTEILSGAIWMRK